jgi:hypothetical protein
MIPPMAVDKREEALVFYFLKMYGLQICMRI